MKLSLAVVLCALAISATGAPTTTPAIKPSNILATKHGETYWNGARVDSPTLNRIFSVAGKMKPAPVIELRPDPKSHYDEIARILALAQKTGATHIGFVGIDSGR